jgi:hypothetical protein
VSLLGFMAVSITFLILVYGLWFMVGWLVLGPWCACSFEQPCHRCVEKLLPGGGNGSRSPTNSSCARQERLRDHVHGIQHVFRYSTVTSTTYPKSSSIGRSQSYVMKNLHAPS